MSSPTTVQARRYRAKYAGSMAGEMKKNVALEPGEDVVREAFIKQQKNWLVWHPGILWLTHRRLVLLEHNLFAPDWILELPPDAVAVVRWDGTKRHSLVEVDYSLDGTTHSVRLLPFLQYVGPAWQERAALFDALREFQQGKLS